MAAPSFTEWQMLTFYSDFGRSRDKDAAIYVRRLVGPVDQDVVIDGAPARPPPAAPKVTWASSQDCLGVMQAAQALAAVTPPKVQVPGLGGERTMMIGATDGTHYTFRVIQAEGRDDIELEMRGMDDTSVAALFLTVAGKLSDCWKAEKPAGLGARGRLPPGNP